MEMHSDEFLSPNLEAFSPLEEITINHRFATYKGVYEGVPVFLKTPVEERLKERLANEADGIRNFFARDPDETLYRVPKLVKIDEGYIVTEFIQGRPMSADFEMGNRDKIMEDIHFLVNTYVFFDSFPGGRGNTRFILPNQQSKAAQVIEKLHTLNAEKLFDMFAVKKIAEYVDEVALDMETRYTHGDLQPGNVIVNTGSKPVIVDFETCSSTWPRHYNIVNFVFNYIEKYPELAIELKGVFQQYCDQTRVNSYDSKDIFNAIAGMRSIQMMLEKIWDSDRNNEPVSKESIEYINSNIDTILAGTLFIDGNNQ